MSLWSWIFKGECMNPTLEEVIAAAQALLEAHGFNVTQQGEKNQAAAIAIREKEEADASSQAEKDALATFRELVNAYSDDSDSEEG